jgi:hypothetical protein
MATAMNKKLRVRIRLGFSVRMALQKDQGSSVISRIGQMQDQLHNGCGNSRGVDKTTKVWIGEHRLQYRERAGALSGNQRCMQE